MLDGDEDVDIKADDQLEPKDAKYWMKLAMDQALIAFQLGEVPIGAILIQHQRSDQGQWIQAEGKGLKHAEYIALLECIKDKHEIENLVLYVTVEPCIMCTHALILAGLKTVYFGCTNSRFGGCGSVLPINQQGTGLECKSGIMEEQCIKILKNFYDQENPNGTKF